MTLPAVIRYALILAGALALAGSTWLPMSRFEEVH